MKTRIAVTFLMLACAAGAVDMGDIGQEYPLYTDADPFAIKLATNLNARLAIEEAERRAGDSGMTQHVATAVSTQAASNAMFTAWFESLQGSTNAWDTAYGWGSPESTLSNRTVTVNGQVGSLNSNLVFTTETTNRVTALHDSRSASYFQTVENGTGMVYEVTGPFTNYTVTLSADFMETVGNTRPAWTNNVFPFSDTPWFGYFFGSEAFVYGAAGAGWSANIGDFPLVLTGFDSAVGTAMVEIVDVYYLTNAIRTFADAATVQQLRADFDGYHPPTTDVLSVVSPAALTIYGANSMTNETGFGAFLSTNNAVNVNIVAVDPVAGQVIAEYLYRVTADRVSGAATLSHHLTTGSGAGKTSSVATVVQAFSPAGVSLASNTVATFRVEAGLIANTNIVASFALPSVASGGVVRVSIVETIGSTRDVTARTGGDYPMALTLTAVPIPYATTSDLDAKLDVTGGTASNLIVTGTLTLTNGTTFAAGVLNTTNGVFWTRLGTNYWILFN